MCDLPAIYHDLSLTSGINVPFIVQVTPDNRLGNYIHASHTIVVNPRVCEYPEAVQRYVITHEMGHSVAVDMDDLSEQGADYYARLWYGDTSALLSFVNQQTDAPLWAHIKRGWK